MRKFFYILIMLLCVPARADETCGNGWTLLSGISTASVVQPIGGMCHGGYTIVSGNFGNFRFVPTGNSVTCPIGQHMSNGTCVNDTIGNCATGFHDATINAAAVIQPIGGVCHGYQAQQTNCTIMYLLTSTATTCGSGEYPTASGCVSNPVENCPANFFAPMPVASFVRANSDDTCPTNYSIYGDLDYCRRYLGVDNMADFCTPQLICTAGPTTMRSSTGMVLPLYDERLTVPALHVGFTNGHICYVNMISGAGTNTINTNYNNQTYHGVE